MALVRHRSARGPSHRAGTTLLRYPPTRGLRHARYPPSILRYRLRFGLRRYCSTMSKSNRNNGGA
eukprot:2996492-Rhodomonas_salina.1